MKSISLFGSQLRGIVSEHVYATTHLTTGFPHHVKSAITKRLNEIVKSGKPTAIKIGKTGLYNSRRNGSVYKDFVEMYILYKSTNKEFVEILESYYNTYAKKKYPKLTVNVKGGSAGVMTNASGFYYLYVALA